ncbi:phosphoribosylformylglycinamidine synthase subunit PurQ [Candidatus Endowatersipora endosymbiont of Watersipora subatra]|uniref:phosphoribosylformylglycinamidine synthase subunit PurQ n=1 Tax=Candidatus Endowatersipora endosymbiont of Watersipora subatra TaxID=3077946 RepID=UPI00312C858B
MKVAILQFPGSNRERDMIKAIKLVSGHSPSLVWHTNAELPDSDLYIIPGGFSYGDYLRSGALAARSPIMNSLYDESKSGKRILGICNGFQILTEAGLLPGCFMKNKNLTFVCKLVCLEVSNNNNPFTLGYKRGEVIRLPVAHHNGNFFCDDQSLKEIEDNNQVAFRYAEGTNPNGSVNNIAGIFNSKGNILGMMPHPENLVELTHGGEEGKRLFEGALNLLETEY